MAVGCMRIVLVASLYVTMPWFHIVFSICTFKEKHLYKTITHVLTVTYCHFQLPVFMLLKCKYIYILYGGHTCFSEMAQEIFVQYTFPLISRST